MVIVVTKFKFSDSLTDSAYGVWMYQDLLGSCAMLITAIDPGVIGMGLGLH